MNTNQTPVVKCVNEPCNWVAWLRAAIHNAAKCLSETTINPKTKETLGAEVSNLTAKGLEALESHIEKQTIENHLKKAQIEKTFEECQKVRREIRKTEAETRKLNAEAIGQELANFERMLKLVDCLETKKDLSDRIDSTL